MKVRSRRSGQFVGRTMRPDQVAAVCYRHKGSSVQFLLVNTGGGKWTFPKGCVDPQLSAIEAASREAAEEAGGARLIGRAVCHRELLPLALRALIRIGGRRRRRRNRRRSRRIDVAIRWSDGRGEQNCADDDQYDGEGVAKA